MVSAAKENVFRFNEFQRPLVSRSSSFVDQRFSTGDFETIGAAQLKEQFCKLGVKLLPDNKVAEAVGAGQFVVSINATVLVYSGGLPLAASRPLHFQAQDRQDLASANQLDRLLAAFFESHEALNPLEFHRDPALSALGELQGHRPQSLRLSVAGKTH